MRYTEELVPMTREELAICVSDKMSEKRFAHVLRVEKKAIELAKRYGGNLEKASIAALTHDYAKERPDSEMIELIQQGLFEKELLEYGNPIWHGVIGSYLVEQELGITDEAILSAVRLHTTGAKEMSLLDKIIYVADYIEEGRVFPLVSEARQIAERDLDEAVAFETLHTLEYLIKNKNKVYPKTLETYNRWVVTH